jgi:simple sugar transport system ATP-binding protein
MVGRKVRLKLDKAPTHPKEVLLSARHIGLKSAAGIGLLNDVSLDLRAGEIVCIAGVSGNGQTELLEILSGIRAPTEGAIAVCGERATADHGIGPARMRQLGVAHVPEDRHRYGMTGGFTASETSILGYHRNPEFRRAGLLDHAAAARHCAELMERYDVRPRRPQQIAMHFSGGNQQKLVMARETDADPRVLLIGQPTRGVDIGAIEFIHRELVRLREAGCAILVVSVELDEVLSLADRILVMYAGRIVGEVDGASADERMLGLMMAGLWKAPRQETSFA